MFSECFYGQSLSLVFFAFKKEGRLLMLQVDKVSLERIFSNLLKGEVYGARHVLMGADFFSKGALVRQKAPGGILEALWKRRFQTV